MWIGIVDDQLVDPIFLDGNLNSGTYLDMLTNQLRGSGYMVAALPEYVPKPLDRIEVPRKEVASEIAGSLDLGFLSLGES